MRAPRLRASREARWGKSGYLSPKKMFFLHMQRMFTHNRTKGLFSEIRRGAPFGAAEFILQGVWRSQPPSLE